MRPLRLSITGLRSYRNRTEIDFTGRGLVAIVGDTGAGKSSILEALTYALYNATTWSGAQSKTLIADGVNTMTVTLTFAVDGEKWEVHRSASRGAYPPPVHRIRNLTHGGAQIDGEAAVTERVKQLLGMEYPAFLAAVVLPQGRFQTLLQAKDSERTGILKAIFEVDSIGQVKDQAVALRTRAESVVVRLQARRDQLPADPAAKVAALSGELNEAEAAEAALRELEDAARETIARGKQERSAVAELREAAGRLAPPAGLAADLADRARRETELRAKLEAAEASRKAAAEAEAGAAAAVAEADAAGEGLSMLTRAEAILDRIVRDLATTARIEAEVAAEQAGLEAELEALVAARDEHQRLTAEVVAAEKRAEVAGQAWRDLEARHRAVGNQVEELRQLEARAAAVREAEAGEVRGREAARGQLVAEMERASAAAEEVERAREALDHARREHAALDLAATLAPGDPCPVCGAPVGDLERRSREAPVLAPLAAALTQAQRAASAAGEAEQTARIALAAIDARLETLHEQLRSLDASLEAGRRRLQELLAGAGSESEPGQMLVRLEAAVRAAAAEAEAEGAQAQQARSAAQLAGTELGRLEATLGERQTALNRRRLELDRLKQSCREELATLPASLRVEGEPDEQTVRERARRAKEMVAAARGREEALRQAIEVSRRTGARVEACAAELRVEIEEPGRAARIALEGLKAQVDQALARLGAEPLPKLPEGTSLETLAGSAAIVEAGARDAAGRLLTLARERETALANAESDLQRRIEAQGFTDLGQLQAALQETTRRAGAVAHQLAEARRQVPEAAELDQRLAEAGQLTGSLKELARLLSDSTFVGWVVRRRQRSLLGIASDLLAGMTGGRYGFADGFQIVDRLTNQERAAATLSGGESFLASLALALGLVELAGRSGRRLDALFLDEGFGSLDSSALDEALTALEARAGGGRLVVVVSHVKAVAERIDDVLEVRKPPTGSTAHWRTRAETEALLEADLELGLKG